MHGGWFCTLLDSAVACAIHTTLPAGKAYTTLELKVNIVRALTDATPLVRAEGKIVHVGRQTATAEGRKWGLMESYMRMLQPHALFSMLLYGRNNIF